MPFPLAIHSMWVDFRNEDLESDVGIIMIRRLYQHITYLSASLILLLISCSSGEKPNYTEHGIASFYADYFEGRLTANGEVFSQDSITAAHQYLPFDTEVEVINEHTGQSVTVRINDRGPFVDGRIIDLSRASKREIGLETEDGLAEVTLRARIDEELADSLSNKLETEE